MVVDKNEVRMTNVSRETLPTLPVEQLDRLANLVRAWDQKKTLISRDDTDTLWERHIYDSARIIKHLRQGEKLADVGSGNGFPGLIIAIAGFPIDLIERSQSKAAFLRYAVAELGMTARIICEDVQKLDAPYDTITARAVAPLPILLRLTETIRHEQTRVLAFVGGAWQSTWQNDPAQVHYDVSVLPEEGAVTMPGALVCVRRKAAVGHSGTPAESEGKSPSADASHPGGQGCTHTMSDVSPPPGASGMPDLAQLPECGANRSFSHYQKIPDVLASQHFRCALSTKELELTLALDNHGRATGPRSGLEGLAADKKPQCAPADTSDLKQGEARSAISIKFAQKTRCKTKLFSEEALADLRAESARAEASATPGMENVEAAWMLATATSLQHQAASPTIDGKRGSR